MLGIRGLGHELDVPKKLHVIAVGLNKMFNGMMMSQEPLVKQCKDEIEKSLETMKWKELQAETCDGVTYIPKRLREKCRNHVKEAEKLYSLINQKLANELQTVAETAAFGAEMGSSVTRLYENWSVRDLGKLWGKWEKNFRGLINGVKLIPE